MLAVQPEFFMCVVAVVFWRYIYIDRYLYIYIYRYLYIYTLLLSSCYSSETAFGERREGEYRTFRKKGAFEGVERGDRMFQA